ncbi:hypothetical protein GCM10017600_71550 [Streptosporangium carneum]|uniref:Uncharacterized protein n=1 Tax=Streptosporangium carneum TaxID=47481 RepID=A0A9W6IA20_9ACTN|nr:hypothetical protein GCM10017600_71550 [Streptosporangium carneum]
MPFCYETQPVRPPARLFTGGHMATLDDLVDTDLRLELILVEALHTEAEQLAAD